MNIFEETDLAGILMPYQFETGGEIDEKFCTAVVLAAGRGSRMGTALAKQYLTLGDKPVVVYSLEAFQASPVIDEIILITDKDHIEYCWEKLVHPYGNYQGNSSCSGRKGTL